MPKPKLCPFCDQEFKDIKYHIAIEHLHLLRFSKKQLSNMDNLLLNQMIDFKKIAVKTEPVDYSDTEEDTKEDAIINTEIVLNNVDVVKREVLEEEDYEAFDVNTTGPEDSTDDQEEPDLVTEPEPAKNPIGILDLCYL